MMIKWCVGITRDEWLYNDLTGWCVGIARHECFYNNDECINCCHRETNEHRYRFNVDTEKESLIIIGNNPHLHKERFTKEEGTTGKVTYVLAAHLGDKVKKSLF